MVFSSGTFLLFFLPLTFIFYHLPFFKGLTYKNLILCLFSLLFYFWGEPHFIFLMLICIFIDWLAGIKMGTSKSFSIRRMWMLFATCIHISVLFVFKYLSFLSGELSSIFSTPTLSIALPIGISFFSFQMMSYVWDVYREKVPFQKSFLKLTLYIMLFPQLIAGPIVRYEEIKEEIDSRRVSLSDFHEGITRFIIGLSKKVLLADMLALIADNFFLAQPYIEMPVLSAWIGAAAFSFQIYFDFSGYSDMAIGLARCFGFHFQENFRHPYIATSVSDFWRRWHISLTSWFRDYVYIPLGGNRVKKSRWIFNLAAVWILTGIWHGANWTFILWGCLYFVFQLIEKLNLFPVKLPALLRWFFTMVIVCCCWVIFKANSITAAFAYLCNMFGSSGVLYDENTIFYVHQCWRLFVISAICSLPLMQIIKRLLVPAHHNKYGNILITCIGNLGLLVLLSLSLLTVLSGAYSPFIYFNF